MPLLRLFLNSQAYPAQDIIPRYLEALSEELILFEHTAVNTVYLGGGTPTQLSPAELNSLLASVRNRLRVAEDAEVTLEANPEHLVKFQPEILSSTGINRLSLGLQRRAPEMLKTLGRNENSFQLWTDKYHDLRSTGISLSLDFIYGIPGDTVEKSVREITEIIGSTPPDHFSLYLLEIKPGTVFQEKMNSGELKLPIDEIQAEIYHALRGLLASHGYQQYEISNFASPGHESRHNLVYFNNGEYLGIGSGAFGRIDNLRYKNSSDLSRYLSCLQEGRRAMEFSETLDETLNARETLMMGLRKNEGVSLRVLSTIKDSQKEYVLERISYWNKMGVIVEDGERIRLNPDYFFTSNEVIGDIIDLN
ncbi:MAG: radical SAM family heme chaperone HemW [Candidatus Wallbacteria bacterium]|nr:radical SAM family heme chaperone HemW [Candidatus Wallbacteria bacterium]